VSAGRPEDVDDAARRGLVHCPRNQLGDRRHQEAIVDRAFRRLRVRIEQPQPHTAIGGDRGDPGRQPGRAGLVAYATFDQRAFGGARDRPDHRHHAHRASGADDVDVIFWA